MDGAFGTDQYSAATAGNNSRLLAETYPDGFTLTYNYVGIDDRISRVTSISSGRTVFEQYLYLGLSTVVAYNHPTVGVNLQYFNTAPPAAGQVSGGDEYTG